MKKTALIKEIKKYGWFKMKEGAKHEKWTNGEGASTIMGRHNDIPELTAKAIIRKAKNNPGKGAK